MYDYRINQRYDITLVFFLDVSIRIIITTDTHPTLVASVVYWSVIG